MSDHPETRPRDVPAKQMGILLFEGVEELDAMGPWEVLSHWTQEYPEDGWQVALVSLDGRPVAGAKGAILTPHEALPRVLDAIVVPGGAGTRPLMRDEPLLARLREFHATGTLVTSVCTGALVLAVAGLLQGRPATTYHACFDELIAAEPTVLPRRVRAPSWCRSAGCRSTTSVAARRFRCSWISTSRDSAHSRSSG